MSHAPLVSIIVPTKNSSEFLPACLCSIRQQTYVRLELIVVDNFSDDDTPAIARRYADIVLCRGPERSAQVNHGVRVSSGEYVYKVDSDFVLDPRVVEQCVQEAEKGFDAIVVHNSPDASVSWIARVRKFEVDMYKYDLTHSSARFVRKDVYEAIGGFDESITAGEDYDFQNRLNRAGFRTGFIDAEALHLGEPKRLIPHLKKMFVYGKDFINFVDKNLDDSRAQLSPARGVFLRHWKLFLLHPLRAASFFLYVLGKFGAGSLGYFVGKLQKQ
jgi:glycosyltransferase involved in cell wall biosynthesis